jgi:2-oxoglutarate ferredoxin oxidoreductase subunit alpha
MTKIDKNSTEIDLVTIRFAGDSGDGMQLTGNQFTTNSALFGNDIATLPDFPAEIRAPAGSLFGVSSFQLQFGSRQIYTAGDDVDVLVAMNPAALKVHLPLIKKGGIIILNSSTFIKKNYIKANLPIDLLSNNSLSSYRIILVDIGRLAFI